MCGVATTEKDLLSLNGGRWVVSVPPHGLSMTQQIEQGLSLARALRDQDSADTQTIQRLFRSMLQMIPILYALNVKINLLTS